jgi:hypothetical protein
VETQVRRWEVDLGGKGYGFALPRKAGDDGLLSAAVAVKTGEMEGYGSRPRALIFWRAALLVI